MLSDSARLLIAALGSVLTLVSYIPYVLDTFRGETKPHAFSWCIWALLPAIGFAGQLAGGGGEGGTILAVEAVFCTFIFIVSCVKGEHAITRSDLISFILALSAIPLWIATSTPLWSMILISCIDGIAFIPTIRKSYFEPSNETLSTWIVSSLKFLLVIASLRSFSVITTVYPATLLVLDGAFVVMLIVRRRTLSNSAIIA